MEKTKRNCPGSIYTKALKHYRQLHVLSVTAFMLFSSAEFPFLPTEEKSDRLRFEVQRYE